MYTLLLNGEAVGRATSGKEMVEKGRALESENPGATVSAVLDNRAYRPGDNMIWLANPTRIQRLKKAEDAPEGAKISESEFLRLCREFRL